MIKNFKKNNSGFTLIELIVVMIIIGILVLLATPRFVRYIEEARYTRIINDIRVVETVSVPEMVKNNMEFPKGTEEEETDLSTFAQEKRAYMKDGIIAAKGISSQFIPEVGNISEFGPDDIRTGYHKLDKKGFIKPETKTRLKGDFYINKEGYVVYVDGKAAKGENIVEEEFIDRTELFLYDDEGGNPGTIIGMNFDHEYFEGNKNKAEVDFLYGFSGSSSEIKKKENLFPDKTYVLPQIPDIRIMNGKTIPVTKIESIMTNDDIVLKIEELIFGDNMREIGEDAFKCTKRIQDPGDSIPYHYNLIATKEEADLDMNQVKTIDEGAFEYIIFTGSFDSKNLTSIGASAFENSKFTGSFDPKNLTSIKVRAFYKSKFTGSFDPKNLTSIGHTAFSDSKFTGSFDPKNLNTIGAFAFFDSEFTGSFDSNNLRNIGKRTFLKSKFDGTFTAGDGLDYIGESAFENSEFTGSFDSNNLRNIGNLAFRNSEFDGTFTAGDGLGYIGNLAFRNSKFTGDFDSKNLETIEKDAFARSKFDGTFTTGDGLDRIRSNTFENSKFTGSFDPNNLTEIDGSAFRNSEFTGDLSTGNISVIKGYAFENSTFDSIKLGKNLSSIGTKAFGNAENASVGSEVKDGKLHSMVLPELKYLNADSLTGLKLEGTLDIPNITRMGNKRIGGHFNPAGFDSCNFTEIIVPNKIKTEEGKEEFINAVKDNIYWEYKM